MPLSYLDDAGYTQGMIRDDPSWQIPNGGTYDQLNLLNDKPGMIRQRMGSTALVSGSQTAFATSIGWVYSNDPTPIEELYGVNGASGAVFSINKANGAATNIFSIGASLGAVGRPARHFGFLIFPNSAPNLNYPGVMVAGQTSSTSFASTSNATVAAGNRRITLSGGDTTANIRVGGIAVSFGSSAYTGRVTSIDSGTTFSVSPVPTASFTIPGGTLTVSPVNTVAGGRCVTSFQNRLLWGNTFDVAAFNTTALVSLTDRRIYYTSLPTEVAVVGASTGYGAWYASIANPVLNYVDVPGSDPIIAMEPISDGELLILTTRDLVILNGNLVTQLATTNPSITYDIYPLGTTNGCLSDLSVHRTPIGIMWAGSEGVFAYWPPLRRNPAKTGIRNLMDNKILTYWQTLVNPSSGSFVIHGAAYVRNHYIISGTSNGVTFSLACNLHNDTWTRLSGAGTDIFMSVARPSIPQQAFAARWWDQTGAAPSMTNGQTVRLEPMFAPYTPGNTTLDADGNPVLFSVTSRVLAGDSEIQKGFQRGTVRYQQASATSAVSVQARAGIDAADTLPGLTTLGSLSSTATLTISAATNANPIVCTTPTHGLQTGDFVDIVNALGMTNLNGRWRVNVLSTTTFSLIGGIGNGAYTASSANVRKVTESDFQMTDVGRNQGVCFVISTGVAVNNFELHGLRVAYLGLAPVMSV